MQVDFFKQLIMKLILKRAPNLSHSQLTKKKISQKIYQLKKSTHGQMQMIFIIQFFHGLLVLCDVNVHRNRAPNFIELFHFSICKHLGRCNVFFIYRGSHVLTTLEKSVIANSLDKYPKTLRIIFIVQSNAKNRILRNGNQKLICRNSETANCVSADSVHNVSSRSFGLNHRT